MTQEVIRRHYLEAMGITAWAAKYQLPNALPTEACEWEDSPPDTTPPRARLQALLDDAPAPKRASPEARKPDATVASPSAVRALLKDTQGTDIQDSAHQRPEGQLNPPSDVSNVVEPAAATPAKPLKFSLSCFCIEGRWLVVQAGEMTVQQQQLLVNLLQAAGVQQGALPEVTHFTWPQLVNAFAVEDPLDEAREGLVAFIAGRVSRQGWQLEKLLWWGELGAEQAPLDRVLNVVEAHSQTLSLPVWQGPSLESLLEGTSSKRELWPALKMLGESWARSARSADDH
ncbi:hypothetical protein LCGC14_0072270 [marine sediment metagenome]|uniref:Uncharacterized protein n=1 Tax=marine sediment metagenome TaxID=412755 RepID=A0A0F9Y171_9ZZZZ|nr:hypothetical protein [Halomonas sp.]HDZ49000.1 hypothetical protein [Halomonas sp.]HEB06378.1 hypothetical protein [Halomonas sp.]